MATGRDRDWRDDAARGLVRGEVQMPAETDIQRQVAHLSLMHDAVIVRDLHDRILTWNEGAAALYGWTHPEVIGRVLGSLLQTRVLTGAAAPPDIRAAVVAHGTWMGEVQHRRRDGTRVVVESRQALLRAADGTPEAIVAVQRDITTARQGMARLQQVTAALSAASTIEAVAEVIITQGLAALGATRGIVALLSDDGTTISTKRATGYTPEIAQDLREFPLHAPVPLADAVRRGEVLIITSHQEYARRYPHLAETRATLGGEALVVVPLLVGERAMGGVALSLPARRSIDEEERRVLRTFGEVCAQALERARLYDVAQEAQAVAETGQHQMEEMARQRNAERDRVQHILDLLPAGVVVADTALRVQLSNRAVYALLGLRGMACATGACETYAPVEDTGISRAAALHLDRTPYEDCEMPLVRAAQQGDEVRGEQMLCEREDGQTITLLVSATPLWGADGSLAGAVGVFQDISALREMEQARELFLASAAHDLKTPLTGIYGLAQLAHRRLARLEMPTTGTILGHLTRIQDSADAMLGLINDMLDVARQHMGGEIDLQRTPIDLVALVTHSVETQRDASGRSIQLDVSVPDLWCEVDAARITRVVGNILSNAMKYSPPDRPITVQLAQEDEGPTGHVAVLRVRDEGVGIPEGDLPHIFDRFHRAQNVVGQIQGTGIGLASAQSIVTQHGGTIMIESEEGQGTTVTVRLPLTVPAAECREDASSE